MKENVIFRALGVDLLILKKRLFRPSPFTYIPQIGSTFTLNKYSSQHYHVKRISYQMTKNGLDAIVEME